MPAGRSCGLSLARLTPQRRDPQLVEHKGQRPEQCHTPTWPESPHLHLRSTDLSRLREPWASLPLSSRAGQMPVVS